MLFAVGTLGLALSHAGADDLIRSTAYKAGDDQAAIFSASGEVLAELRQTPVLADYLGAVQAYFEQLTGQ